MKNYIAILFVLLSISTQAKDTNIYQFEIKREIDAPAWKITKTAIEEGLKSKADLFLLVMDTYGGRVDYADSIRSLFLDLETPIYVMIKNNAASAGALISIACDSIYMNTGSTIGAATVVDQNGTPAAEKYQSFFRGKMRATAIAKNRNPDIAEAMVDASIAIDGIVDSTTLITFTVDEAINNGFCEGRYENAQELISGLGLKDAKVTVHQSTALDEIVLILIDPTVSGLLMMIMMGGLFLELKTPGVGFAGLLSISAALLYFAPHYIHGLADHIEILAVGVGVALILLEVFVIPGTGLAGIVGTILLIGGLSFSLIDKIPVIDDEYYYSGSEILWAFVKTLGSISLGVIGSLFLASKILQNKGQNASKFVLETSNAQDKIAPNEDVNFQELIGKGGIAFTDLSPGGKVSIDGEIYDAISRARFIEKGANVSVISSSNSQLKVRQVE